MSDRIIRFRALQRHLQVSIEENGIAERELEYVFYGKVVDFAELEKVAERSEYQEQYQVMRKNGTIRARMVRSDSGTTYVITTKSWTPGVAGKSEAELEGTEDMFQHFKSIAESGMQKRRYFLKAGVQRTSDGDEHPLTWEVDVFYDLEGKRSDWCKIDLEVPQPLKELPTLPIELEEVITNQYGKRTRDEIEKLKQLFEEEFTVRPNEEKDETDIDSGVVPVSQAE